MKLADILGTKKTTEVKNSVKNNKKTKKKTKKSTAKKSGASTTKTVGPAIRGLSQQNRKAISNSTSSKKTTDNSGTAYAKSVSQKHRADIESKKNSLGIAESSTRKNTVTLPGAKKTSSSASKKNNYSSSKSTNDETGSSKVSDLLGTSKSASGSVSFKGSDEKDTSWTSSYTGRHKSDGVVSDKDNDGKDTSWTDNYTGKHKKNADNTLKDKQDDALLLMKAHATKPSDEDIEKQRIYNTLSDAEKSKYSNFDLFGNQYKVNENQHGVTKGRTNTLVTTVEQQAQNAALREAEHVANAENSVFTNKINKQADELNSEYENSFNNIEAQYKSGKISYNEAISQTDALKKDYEDKFNALNESANSQYSKISSKISENYNNAYEDTLSKEFAKWGSQNSKLKNFVYSTKEDLNLAATSLADSMVDFGATLAAGAISSSANKSGSVALGRTGRAEKREDFQKRSTDYLENKGIYSLTKQQMRDDIAEDIMSWAQNTGLHQNALKMQQNLLAYSEGMKGTNEMLNNVIQQTAQNLPTMLISMINPAVGLSLFGVSAAGMSAMSAYDSGATIQESLQYGILAGAGEVGTELLFPAVGGAYGTAVSSALIKKFVSKATLGKTTKILTQQSIDALKASHFANSVSGKILKGALMGGGEATEEMIMEVVDPYLQRLTYNPSANAATLDEITEAGIMGFAVSAVLGVPATVQNVANQARLNKFVKTVNMDNLDSYFNLELKKLENKLATGEITQEEWKKQSDKIIKLNNKISTRKGTMFGITSVGDTKNENSTYEPIVAPENAYSTATSLANKKHKEYVEGFKEDENVEGTGGKIILDENNNLKKVSVIVYRNGEFKRITYPVVNGKIVQDALSETDLTEEEIEQVKARYENMSDKSNSARYTGGKFDVKESDIKLAEDIKKTTGINIVFYRGNAKMNNAYEDKNTIFINTNSKNVTASIISHELMHVIQTFSEDKSSTKDKPVYKADSAYESLRKMVMEFYGEKQYNERKEAIRRTYKEIDDKTLDQEVMSHFVEQKLITDQGLIDRFTSTNRAASEKIIDSLNDKIVNMFGTAEQKQLIKMREMFAKAVAETYEYLKLDKHSDLYNENPLAYVAGYDILKQMDSMLENNAENDENTETAEELKEKSAEELEEEFGSEFQAVSDTIRNSLSINTIDYAINYIADPEDAKMLKKFEIIIQALAGVQDFCNRNNLKNIHKINKYLNSDEGMRCWKFLINLQKYTNNERELLDEDGGYTFIEEMAYFSYPDIEFKKNKKGGDNQAKIDENLRNREEALPRIASFSNFKNTDNMRIPVKFVSDITEKNSLGKRVMDMEGKPVEAGLIGIPIEYVDKKNPEDKKNKKTYQFEAFSRNVPQIFLDNMNHSKKEDIRKYLVKATEEVYELKKDKKKKITKAKKTNSVGYKEYSKEIEQEISSLSSTYSKYRDKRKNKEETVARNLELRDASVVGSPEYNKYNKKYEEHLAELNELKELEEKAKNDIEPYLFKAAILEQSIKNPLALMDTVFNAADSNDFKFNVGADTISKMQIKGVQLPLRKAEKTVLTINLNSACPMITIGNHACYLDACYMTQMGEGAMGVNLFKAAMYTGEILQLSDKSIKDMNHIGGLRLNGIGDTIIENRQQYFDVLRHAEMRGLDIKVISKQEETFRIVEDYYKLGGNIDRVIVQPSLDFLWVPVEEDAKYGSWITKTITDAFPGYSFPLTKADADRLEDYFSSDALERYYNDIVGRSTTRVGKDNRLYRKYGFDEKQLIKLREKYPDVHCIPRYVVCTVEEMAYLAYNNGVRLNTDVVEEYVNDNAVNGGYLIQTPMHGKVPKECVSLINGNNLDDTGEVKVSDIINFGGARHVIKKVNGKWLFYGDNTNLKIPKTKKNADLFENYEKKKEEEEEEEEKKKRHGKIEVDKKTKKTNMVFENFHTPVGIDYEFTIDEVDEYISNKITSYEPSDTYFETKSYKNSPYGKFMEYISKFDEETQDIIMNNLLRTTCCQNNDYKDACAGCQSLCGQGRGFNAIKYITEESAKNFEKMNSVQFFAANVDWKEFADEVKITEDNIAENNDKESVESIRRSKPFDSSSVDEKDVGYHAGDLGKSESLSQQGFSRGTGHFGTGTYFVGNEDELKHGYGDRPVEKVNFSKYNLFKPKDSKAAETLHRFLKFVDGYYYEDNRYINSDDYEKYVDDIEHDIYDGEMNPGKFNKILNDIKRFKTDYSIRNFLRDKKYIGYRDYDIDNIYDDFLSEYEELDFNGNIDNDKAVDFLFDLLRFDRRADRNNLYYYEEAEDLIKDASKVLNVSTDEIRNKLDSIYKDVSGIEFENGFTHDSVATMLMKSLGYEGIDTRHIKEFDNTMYGSVIYDLKDEDLARKKEIGTARYSKTVSVNSMNEMDEYNYYHNYLKYSNRLIEVAKDINEKWYELFGESAPFRPMKKSIFYHQFFQHLRREAEKKYNAIVDAYDENADKAAKKYREPDIDRLNDLWRGLGRLKQLNAEDFKPRQDVNYLDKITADMTDEELVKFLKKYTKGLDDAAINKIYADAVKHRNFRVVESMLKGKANKSGAVPVVSVADYINKDTRKLALKVKDADIGSLDIIGEQMADYLNNKNTVLGNGEKYALIPMPSHNGDTSAMRELAEVILDYAGRDDIKIADVLKGENRNSRAILKKYKMPDEEIEFSVKGKIPKGYTPLIIDNVISTGVTAKAAYDALKKYNPIVFAYSANLNSEKALNDLKKFDVTYDNGELVDYSDRFTDWEYGRDNIRYSKSVSATDSITDIENTDEFKSTIQNIIDLENKGEFEEAHRLYDDYADKVGLTKLHEERNKVYKENPVRYSKSVDNPVRVVSLFTGIGAFEKALENIGVPYNVLAYSDIDDHAPKTYEALYGISQDKNLGNVVNIDYSNLEKDIDLLTCGFPCTNFSRANGKRKGLFDENGDLTESGLFFYALPVIDATQPKVVVLENTADILNKRFIGEFNIIKDEMEGVGYNVFHKVLKASDYGVPQDRKRIYVVCIRKDIDCEFEFPEKTGTDKTLWDILESDVSDDFYLSEDKVMAKKAKKSFALKPLNKMTLPKANAKTLTTKVDRDTNTHIEDEKGVRKLTPREYWRLQGFTDEDFDKAQSVTPKTALYREAGNSIAVPVMEKVFDKIFYGENSVIDIENTEDNIRYSKTPVSDVFYSKLEDVVETKMPKKIGALQVENFLKGKGVKEEEIKWSGIRTFLQGKKSVTKEELLEFVKANEVQIAVEDGGNRWGPGFFFNGRERDYTTKTSQPFRGIYESDFPDELNDAILALTDDLNEFFDGEINESRVSNLVAMNLTNSEDYYEFDDMLYSDIERIIEDFLSKDKYKDVIEDDVYDKIYSSYNNVRDNSVSLLDLKYDTDFSINDYETIKFKWTSNNEYENSDMYTHWEDSNILAHSRIDKRHNIDTDNIDTLFIEEIQSDWHNKGKAHGYENLSEDERTKVNKLKNDYSSELKKLSKLKITKSDLLENMGFLWYSNDEEFYLLESYFDRGHLFGNRYVDEYIRDNNINSINDISESDVDNIITSNIQFFGGDISTFHEFKKIAEEIIEENKKCKELYEKIKEIEGDGKIPDAPYSKTYHEFVLKYLLHKAVKDDMKYLAWTTEQMQVDRWSEEHRKAYHILYGQDIPNFLKKYCKQWGSKLTEVNIGTDVNGNDVVVPAVEITDEMKKSVLEDKQPRYSKSIDATYMELAEDPVANETELQKMVDEEAKRKGFSTKKLYHGTSEFGFTKLSIHNTYTTLAFFTTDSEEMAKSYSSYRPTKHLYDKYDDSKFERSYDEAVDEFIELLDEILDKHLDETAKRYIRDLPVDHGIIEYKDNLETYTQSLLENDSKSHSTEKKALLSEKISDLYDLVRNISLGTGGLNLNNRYGVYAFYAKMGNMLVVDANGDDWSNIIVPDEIADDYSKWEETQGITRRMIDSKYSSSTDILCNYARTIGYDGVVIKNVNDYGDNFEGYHEPADDYIFFVPQHQLKSADPVTYDEDGNVIPLSERFNESNDDIRYSKTVDVSGYTGVNQTPIRKKEFTGMLKKLPTFMQDTINMAVNDIFEHSYYRTGVDKDSMSNMLSNEIIRLVYGGDYDDDNALSIAQFIYETGTEEDVPYFTYSSVELRPLKVGHVDYLEIGKDGMKELRDSLYPYYYPVLPDLDETYEYFGEHRYKEAGPALQDALSDFGVELSETSDDHEKLRMLQSVIAAIKEEGEKSYKDSKLEVKDKEELEQRDKECSRDLYLPSEKEIVDYTYSYLDEDFRREIYENNAKVEAENPNLIWHEDKVKAGYIDYPMPYEYEIMKAVRENLKWIANIVSEITETDYTKSKKLPWMDVVKGDAEVTILPHIGNGVAIISFPSGENVVVESNVADREQDIKDMKKQMEKWKKDAKKLILDYDKANIKVFDDIMNFLEKKFVKEKESMAEDFKAEIEALKQHNKEKLEEQKAESKEKLDKLRKEKNAEIKEKVKKAKEEKAEQMKRRAERKEERKKSRVDEKAERKARINAAREMGKEARNAWKKKVRKGSTLSMFLKNHDSMSVMRKFIRKVINGNDYGERGIDIAFQYMAFENGIDTDTFFTIANELRSIRYIRKNGKDVAITDEVTAKNRVIKYISNLDLSYQQKEFLFYEFLGYSRKNKVVFVDGGKHKPAKGNRRNRIITICEKLCLDMYRGVPCDMDLIDEIVDITFENYEEEDIEKRKQEYKDYVVSCAFKASEEMTLTRTYTKMESELPKQSKKGIARRLMDSFRLAFTAEGIAFEQMAKKIGDVLLKARYYQAKNAVTRANEMINGEGQYDLLGNRVGDSLAQILKEYLKIDKKNKNNEMMDALMEFCNLRHDIYRMQYDKEYTGYSEEECREKMEELAKKYDDLNDVADKVSRYCNNLLLMCVQAGRLSQEDYEFYSERYPFYVPTFRVHVEETERDGIRIKARTEVMNVATNSKDQLLPLFDQLVRRTREMCKASMNNMLAKQLAQHVGDPSAASFIGDIEITKEAEERQALREQSGADYNEAVARDMETIGMIESIGTERDKDDSGNTIPVWLNGDKYILTINSESMLYGWDKINAAYTGIVHKILTPLKAYSKFKRAVMTQYSITFPITNGLRDLADMYLYNNHAQRLVKYHPIAVATIFGMNRKNYIRKLYSKLTDKEIKLIENEYTEAWNEYLSSGVMGATVFEYSDDVVGRVKETGINKKKPVLDQIDAINFAIEQAPRFAVYLETLDRLKTDREDGLNDYTDEEIKTIATYHALEATLNFGRSGTITKALNTYGFTFLNAGVQGTIRFVKIFTQTTEYDNQERDYNETQKKIVGLVLKCFAFGMLPEVAFNIALLAIRAFGDDDDEYKEKLQEYKDFPDYLKSMYLLIPLAGKNNWLKIPYGRVAGFLNSIADTSIELVTGSSDQTIGEQINDLWQTASDTILFANPFTNNIAAPFIDAIWRNKNYLGYDIVPEYDEKEDGFHYLEYDEDTSWFAKALANVFVGDDEKASLFDLSPIKIDYIINENFGSYANAITSLLDMDLGLSERVINALDSFARKFYVDPVYSNNYSDKYYDTRSYIEGMVDKYDGDTPYSTVQKLFDAQDDRINEVRDQIESVENNTNLSREKRKERLRELRELLNDLYKEVNDNYRSILADAQDMYDCKENAKDNFETILDGYDNLSGLKIDYLTMNSDDLASAWNECKKLDDIDENVFYSAVIAKRGMSTITDVNGETIDVKTQFANYLDAQPYSAKAKEYLFAFVGKYRDDIGFTDGVYEGSAALREIQMGSASMQEDYSNALNYGVTAEQFLNVREYWSSTRSTRDENNKEVEGQTRMDKVISYIQSLNLSSDQKKGLFLYAAKYSAKNLPVFTSGGSKTIESPDSITLETDAGFIDYDGAYISSGYGPRNTGIAGASTNHMAVDIAAAEGSSVGSIYTGVVTSVTHSGGYGNSVEITSTTSDGKVVVMKYSHLKNTGVTAGQTVAAGIKIGEVGQTGTASGPHVDLKMKLNGEYVDPSKYINVAKKGKVDSSGYTVTTGDSGKSVASGGSSGSSSRSSSSGSSSSSSSSSRSSSSGSSSSSSSSSGSSSSSSGSSGGSSGVSLRGTRYNSNYTSDSIGIGRSSGGSTYTTSSSSSGVTLPKASFTSSSSQALSSAGHNTGINYTSPRSSTPTGRGSSSSTYASQGTYLPFSNGTSLSSSNYSTASKRTQATQRTTRS